MCLALMGPGDTAIVPAPSYPGPSLRRGPGRRQLDPAGGGRQREAAGATSPTPAEHMVPRPKVVIVNFPHNPSTATVVEPEFYVEVVKLAKRYGFMVISDLAYADVTFDGYVTPSFLAAPGAIDVGVEFTTMSKGYNMAGWRVGLLRRQRRDDPGAGHDQGLLRLRHVSADPDRRDHGPAAYRRGRRGPVPSLPAPPRRALRRAGAARLADHAAQGHDVRLGQDSRALGQPDDVRSTSP